MCVVGAIILNHSYYLQNFHLIDYNMLVFTVIILARRLIAAIVKEVRILFMTFTFSVLKHFSIYLPKALIILLYHVFLGQK